MTDRRPCESRGRQAGFTLIELMVALVVISIGIMALSGLQTRSSRDVYTTGRRTRALALAQQQIEIARGAGYAAAASATGTLDRFNWSTQVDSAGFELKRVSVVVSWPEQTLTRSLQLQTLISLR